MKRIIVLISLACLVWAQLPQQEFLHPSKVRKKYKFKEFQTILYADDEVFTKDPDQQNKEFIETTGYRIQLIATQNLNEALSTKAILDSLYTLPVYMDFEPPNYKVRIGNYLTNEEAQSMQSQLQRQGFTYAWVVPSKIIVVK